MKCDKKNADLRLGADIIACPQYSSKIQKCLTRVSDPGVNFILRSSFGNIIGPGYLKDGAFSIRPPSMKAVGHLRLGMSRTLFFVGLISRPNFAAHGLIRSSIGYMEAEKSLNTTKQSKSSRSELQTDGLSWTPG